MFAIFGGCILAAIRSAREIPAIHNRRPIMVQNDTRVFDLMELAPVVHGWVLLGEVGRYVQVSRDRFGEVAFAAEGLRATLSGSPGEEATFTALKPAPGGDWIVQVRRVAFGESGQATLTFS
jgi:hypothetical protein